MGRRRVLVTRSSMDMFSISDNRKIGIFLGLISGLFLFLGVIFFFDWALLAIGNIMFVAAFPFLIGFQRTIMFFNPFSGARRSKLIGILLFISGFTLVVFFRWPFFWESDRGHRRIPVIQSLH